MTDKKRVSSQFDGEKKDAVEILMGGSKQPQRGQKRGNKGVNEGLKGGNIGVSKTPMKKYNIWLHGEDWNALKGYFDNKGIPVRTGIRSIIKEYMKKEGI